MRLFMSCKRKKMNGLILKLYFEKDYDKVKCLSFNRLSIIKKI